MNLDDFLADDGRAAPPTAPTPVDEVDVSHAAAMLRQANDVAAGACNKAAAQTEQLHRVDQVHRGMNESMDRANANLRTMARGGIALLMTSPKTTKAKAAPSGPSGCDADGADGFVDGFVAERAEPVFVQGLMLKRGPHRLQPWPWRERYCKLKGTQLLYADCAQATEWKRISLTPTSGYCRLAEADPDEAKKHKHGFAVWASHGARKYLFDACTEECRKKWLDGLAYAQRSAVCGVEQVGGANSPRKRSGAPNGVRGGGGGVDEVANLVDNLHGKALHLATETATQKSIVDGMNDRVALVTDKLGEADKRAREQLG